MNNKKYTSSSLLIEKINSMNIFYKNINIIPFTENEVAKINKSILNLLKTDMFQKKYYSNIPIHSLNIFHLICEYKLAYEASKEKLPDSLALLKKGSKKREQRRDENIKIMLDDSKSEKEILIATYENIFLDLLLNEKTEKISTLILGFAFMLREMMYEEYKKLTSLDKTLSLAVEELNSSLDFFTYTYLAPSKIVNSLSILLYRKLKSIENLDELDIQRFIQNISNLCFRQDAIEIRKENYKREMYIAGIYNKSVIFQWYSSTQNEHYYSDEELQLILDFIQPFLIDESIIYQYFSKLAETKYKQKFDPSKLNIEFLRKTIDETILIYACHTPKLTNKLPKSPKTLKHYLVYPIYYISTKFVALLTKFEMKKNLQ